MHVKVNYPDAVMQIREIKCSVKAGDIIGEKLENHIQELDDNITVKESRKSGIERRERILNIQPSSSSDLETRKIAVIARWCISTMYTERILQKRLQSMLGDGYNLEVNIQQKTVSVNSYGESTEITECEITNCSMGRSVLIGHETGGSNMNINVTQWNNEIR